MGQWKLAPHLQIYRAGAILVNIEIITEQRGEDVLQPPGLTITEAAKRLRVHRRTLSVLLHEKTALSRAMAIRIAKATRTSPES